MKVANRQAQHRPQREEQKSKELNDLKRENHKLARDRARLQKELEKALQTKSEFEGEAAEELAESKPKSVEQTPCPECGATKVRKLSLAGKDYYICAECKWRRPADRLPPKPDEQ